MAAFDPRIFDIEKRLRSLDDWRRDHAGELRRLEATVEQHIQEYEPIIDRMVERDKVSEALAEAAKTTRQIQREASTLHLSWLQLTIAAVVGIGSIIGTIVTLVRL